MELTAKYFGTLNMAEAKVINTKLLKTVIAGWITLDKNSTAKLPQKANA
jgi:hypothetical protein